MVGWAERLWKQQDQYDWLSAYLDERGLQTFWRFATFGFTLAMTALPIMLLWSPAGPDHPATIVVALLAAGVGIAGALLWLLRWPTRQQSVIYSLMGGLAVGAMCLAMSNPYTGLMGCTIYAVIGGVVAYFHTVGLTLVNLGMATVCSVILAYRLVLASGDVALTAAALVTVAALNVGVPFGIQSLMHTLRTDLRGSDRDSLTGLHNRRSFNSTVYELMMLDRRRAGRLYLVMVMIDLDNFKQLNDTRGHAAGDEALVSVSAALEENCRSTAVIGRVGGEEFLVADVATSPNPAKLAERLREAIAKIPFPVTASIGTAGAPLETNSAKPNLELIDDLIRTSDTAMYDAKRAGGNRVCHYPTLVSGPAALRSAEPVSDQ
ncbi:diguanylate cyclase [Mycolicibacterium holsaticum]|uniref:Diguanylate cyclase n=2 Tax=Mycolicibacterium holsaticum TaxID=152142 RepID=A0A1E3RUQ1_9MYCO|nr:diguanylate cyclase [Mycolicibacterium holsaticum DSM 44478 = JCM 12374]ODQ93590.1 diguanylate cyclase [Mycolicibacterium holsaticum]QZA14762.1 GGDEF domain-containing protein [Mycolicibacterium holsaticum DSM 44478 = JCM 12374]UNC07795.1 diguanylate cyclase [Mycolicibacterium holsaticum DSM 44478 = JCM 12374]